MMEVYLDVAWCICCVMLISQARETTVPVVNLEKGNCQLCLLTPFCSMIDHREGFRAKHAELNGNMRPVARNLKVTKRCANKDNVVIVGARELSTFLMDQVREFMPRVQYLCFSITKLSWNAQQDSKAFRLMDFGTLTHPQLRIQVRGLYSRYHSQRTFVYHHALVVYCVWCTCWRRPASHSGAFT